MWRVPFCSERQTMRKVVSKIVGISLSGIMLAGCGVNTNSRSYKIGYSTGSQDGMYQHINCDKGPIGVFGQQGDISVDKSQLNWDDYMAGCEAGKADAR